MCERQELKAIILLHEDLGFLWEEFKKFSPNMYSLFIECAQKQQYYKTKGDKQDSISSDSTDYSN